MSTVEMAMRNLIDIVERASYDEAFESGYSSSLYHTTSFSSALSILRGGGIFSSIGGYVCTTRDRNLRFKDGPVQFVIDKTKVGTRFSIEPVDYYAGTGTARRDSEERIMTDELPLSMIKAVMLNPVEGPPGIRAAMMRQGDEVAELAKEHGIEVIDLRAKSVKGP